MNRPLIILSCVFLLASSALSAAKFEKVTQKTFFNGEKLFEYRLPNGLQVLFVPRHQAKVLTYQVWFHVGSNDEKLDPKLNKTGLAHLFEHMMFRGSEKYPQGQFPALTSRMGAERMNATTSTGRTNYFENIPSKYLDQLMALESDRMRHLNLTLQGMTEEKGAVVGELRRHLDSPSAGAYEELERLAYDVLPFRFTTLGTEAEIKGFTLEEAQYFYKTYYAPNNATIIVVGDTTEEELLPLVDKYYGDMKSQVVPQAKMPDEPVQTKERRSTITHPQATSDILVIGYRIAPVNSPDIIPLSILADHLSAGMEARLRKLLVDTGIAVRASADAGSGPDQFTFSVQLSEKHSAAEALKIIDKEVASLRRNKISQAAFERAVNQNLLGAYTGIGDNASLATQLGESLELSGNYMRNFEILEGYKKSNPDDLLRVAKKYLVKESRAIVVVRPGAKSK